MATLKDVAKLANVDVSTVSRALNNTSYVHPETKERVYAAARELGYHPNVIARALRQGHSYIIGVVVPRLHLTIFSEILQGIEEQARKLGYMTTVCVTEDDPRLEKDRLGPPVLPHVCGPHSHQLTASAQIFVLLFFTNVSLV